ncbi:substrate-binding domain-containing protein [Pseudorhodoferax soli]|uniref:Extracellular solute-binding protein n=1 Tax=Pseudorhodoferax soli TaxID=545864 RepID=A0A368XKY3_9BURK|nr:substrate-binding domain-containing protein [Pseudorhodoferax soli]RCW68515.1 extracellular solute-binding protein [Pseudorhodoferax soli]
MKARFIRGVGALGIAAAAMSSHAACTTIGSTGTVGFNLAVASNFYLSAQSIAAGFLAIGPKAYDIYICEGSSAALYSAIVPSNTPQYAMFMSADAQRPADIASMYSSLTASAPFRYANGTPVFLLSPNAYAATSGSYPAVNYLVTGLSSSSSPPFAEAARSSTGLPVISNNVALSTTPPTRVSTLAVAEPSLAPYGVQAQVILNLMGQWVTPTSRGTNVTTACSSAICAYDNINLTLNAINNNAVTAGFVSYGQVCPALTGTTYAAGRYVLFPKYPTSQDAIMLKTTDATAQTKASDFATYMLGGAGATNWNTWLTNNCYQAI